MVTEAIPSYASPSLERLLRCYLCGESARLKIRSHHGCPQELIQATFSLSCGTGAACPGRTRGLGPQDRASERQRDQRDRDSLFRPRRECCLPGILAAFSQAWAARARDLC